MARSSHAARGAVAALGLALVAVAAAGCPAPAPIEQLARRRPPPGQFTLGDLIGGWRWLHRTTEDGTTRIEDEVWRFRPIPGELTRLIGRYVRTVEVHSDDRVAFRCNQRPWYRQRAVFDVEVTIAASGFTIRETAHRAEPSPCDRGFRRLGVYAAELAGVRLALKFDEPGGTSPGVQTLWKIDGENAELPDEPWLADPPLAGAWRWDSTAYDDDGNIRDETEWWQIAQTSETRLDATYRRRVTVRAPAGGAPIACANAPSWSFDDAYVLVARREDEHWRFTELAGEAAPHPCLRGTPRRDLDEATAAQVGEHVILEWRGKRRQVLYRP